MIEHCFKILESNAPFLSFELTPRVSGSSDSALIEDLQSLDFINAFVCTDSPLARFKPSSVLSSLKFQNALKKPLICTLSMRDRNSIALCGEILAVNELGIRAFLGVSGDPIKLGDSLESKGVFEDKSSKIAQIITNLNAGFDLNKKPLKSAVEKIYYCAAINAFFQNPKSIESRIFKKLQSGAVALFSQPVYCVDSAKILLESIENANVKLGRKAALIFGFFPVSSYKSALFLRDKLPGVFIPESWITKLEKASSKGKEEEYKIGLELSRELLENLKKIHNKFHFMSNNKSAILRELWG